MSDEAKHLTQAVRALKKLLAAAQEFVAAERRLNGPSSEQRHRGPSNTSKEQHTTAPAAGQLGTISKELNDGSGRGKVEHE